MNDSLTQGTKEGGASAPPTEALFVKSRHDGSTFAATQPYEYLPEMIPEYRSTEAARQDRDFKGGYFWVRSKMRLWGAAAFAANEAQIAVIMRGLRQVGRLVEMMAVEAREVHFRTEADVTSETYPPEPKIDFARLGNIFTVSTARPELAKDTNPKTVFGEAKPSLSLIPGAALVEVAMAMREGKAKYGSMNWREDPVSATTYADAALRHLFQWLDGEDRCPKSRAFHLAHLAANAMILLDAGLQGTLIDDRPPAGTTSEAIENNTRPIKGVAPPSEDFINAR